MYRSMGSPELQSKLRALTERKHYSDRLAESLGPVAANIELFELALKPGSTLNLHKQTNRTQNRDKYEPTRDVVYKALVAVIIVPSPSGTWSRILLTLKLNEKWRFCCNSDT